jgi:hypothetical protein
VPGIQAPLLIRLAWGNVFLHVVGLVVSWFWLRPGSLLVPLAERTSYLDSHGAVWGWGWAVWAVCAVALVAFNAALVEPLGERPFLPRLALVLSVGGMAVDLVCDAVQIWLLPGLDGALFESFERLAFAGGATVANGLYTASVALLNVRLSGQARGTTLAAGWVTVAAGSAMAVSGALGSPQLLQVATGPTIVGYSLWVVLVARNLDSKT